MNLKIARFVEPKQKTLIAEKALPDLQDMIIYIVHIAAQKLEQGAEKTVIMTLLMFGTHLKRENINKKISLGLALFVAVQM